MQETTSPANIAEKDIQNGRALALIALFVVALIPFLVHYNLLKAPLQGNELRLILFDDLLHSPSASVTALDRMPGSPLGAVAVGFFWWLGGGSAEVMRITALLVWVISALLLVHALRLWLCRNDSIAVPLLGGLLYALCPLSVFPLAALDAWPSLLALVFAVTSLTLFLQATKKPGQIDLLFLVLSCCALALAAAAYYSLLVLPVFLVIIDLLRFDENGHLRLKPEGTAYLVLAGCAVAVGTVMWSSKISFGSFMPSAALIFIFVVCVLVLAWLSAKLSALSNVFSVVMIFLVIGNGVLSFRQALQYMDPIDALERACMDTPNMENSERLVLQYMEAARTAPDAETKSGYLLQALAVYGNDADRHDATRRLLGQHLLEAGNVEQSAQLLEPYLQEAPFDEAGRLAALALARATNERESPGKVADYYAIAAGNKGLSGEDTARYGRALIALGDVTNAVLQFSSLPEPKEGSDLAMFKKQATTAYASAQGLLEKAREKMTADPTDPEGYVMSAQRELLLGNNVRSFYWLELALRRNPEHVKAWELMGVIFARHNQADQFIAQWGATKPQGDQAWLRLAQQAAMFQSWDGALIFANRFVSDATPSAEEMLAAVALEMRNVKKAQEWLEKAAQKRPDSPTPWLLLADLAFALQQPDESRRCLEEAQKRNAPVEEIEKRKAKYENGATPPPEATPFEPVRTYIQ